MAINVVQVKCPACRADFSIDEAGIKQAETDRMIRLKEMELEEKEALRNRRSKAVAFGIALTFVLLFREGGFTNVRAVPLGDLTMFNQKNNGKVEMVTVNGSYDFEEGDVFPRNANVLITYHSKA